MEDRDRQMQSLAECWERFRSETIPANMPSESLARAKMVFYAGAAFMLDQHLAIGDPRVNEEVGVAHLQSISKELDEFATALGEKVVADEAAKRTRRGGRGAWRRMH